MTNKDFSKYQSIIDHFRGKVSSKGFEAEFAKATQKLPKNERFLLKMELKRLATPCTRLIDLRGLVDGNCRPYENEGRTHFLDDEAIRVFELNYSYYGGYTFGVYDAVNNTENNFRVIYQKEKTQAQNLVNKESTTKAHTVERTQYPAQFFSTAEYFDRSEERMNFAIPVLIILEDGTELETFSSDISPHGLRIKIKTAQGFHLDQVLSVQLSGLEKEFQFGTQNLFDYQVMNLRLVDNTQWIGLKRINLKEKDSFLHFLKNFIQGNKRRYKVNLDNTIQALQSRTFEQYAVPMISELPVFLSVENEHYHIKYTLKGAHNHSIAQYWQNEKGQQTLSFLLNNERMATLNSLAKQHKSLIVYCFTHMSKDRLFFYTADNVQLHSDDTLFKNFVSFAAQQDSFKIFKLSSSPVKAELGYVPYALNNTLSTKDEYLNQPLSKEVTKILLSLNTLVTISDITTEDIKADYSSFSDAKISSQFIKPFGHKYTTSIENIDEAGLNYRNHRREQRFIYNTPVHIELDKIKSVGHSQDFSVSGLRITLQEATDLNIGDIIDITFPKLQQITSTFDLKQLPYEVVRVNKAKTVFNLKIHVEKHQHVGRNFFKLLIEKNRHKLTTDEYSLLTPGLAKALRNIYSGTMTIPSLIVQSSGSRYKTESIVASKQMSLLFAEMEQLSERKGYFNLYPLLSLSNESKISDAQLKRMLPTSATVEEVIYIAINPSKSLVEDKVIVKLEKELTSTSLKKMFIKRAIKNGQFYCVKLVLARTEPPDMRHLNPELSYIGSYAIHRAKQLEQSIWSVSGTIRCYEITDEAMIRYQMS